MTVETPTAVVRQHANQVLGCKHPVAREPLGTPELQGPAVPASSDSVDLGEPQPSPQRDHSPTQPTKGSYRVVRQNSASP